MSILFRLLNVIRDRDFEFCDHDALVTIGVLHLVHLFGMWKETEAASNFPSVRVFDHKRAFISLILKLTPCKCTGGCLALVLIKT